MPRLRRAGQLAPRVPQKVAPDTLVTEVPELFARTPLELGHLSCRRHGPQRPARPAGLPPAAV